LPFRNLKFTGHGIPLAYLLQVDTENTYLIYHPKTDRVGTYCNSIADFGKIATPIVATESIITFGTIKEFLVYSLDIANNHRDTMTLAEYAETHRLRKLDVRLFCQTAYAHVLGVRKLGTGKRTSYAIPSTLDPARWAGLRSHKSTSRLRSDIVKALDLQPVALPSLYDKLSPPYNKEVLRKTIARLVAQRILVKTGARNKAQIALAPPEHFRT